MRILVSQITRMGDVIQTSPLFDIIKRKYPDSHITALVRSIGKPIAERIPQVDDVVVYDEDDLFLDLVSEDSGRLVQAYNRTDAMVQDLRKRGFDLIYNCTHSTTSALLLKVVGCANIIGTDFSDDWRFVIRGPWVNYFFTSVMSREFNSLNVCDVGQRFELDADGPAGLAFAVTDADREAAHALMTARGLDDGAPILCIQLGASDDNKRWSMGYFAALAQRIRNEFGAHIVLVGVDSEKRFGEAFEALAPGLAVHLFGQTSIPVLAALLEASRLLVTNDTGTMHIAAAVGCPIVLVSVGYVQFRETGPYSGGCYAIERRRSDVKHTAWSAEASDESEHPLPEAVFRVVERAWYGAEADAAQWSDWENWPDTYVYRSVFSADGCLEWHPLVRRAPTANDLYRMIYRAMWLDHLGNFAGTRNDDFAPLLAQFNLADFGMTAWRSELDATFTPLAAMAAEGVMESEILLDRLARRHAYDEAKAIVGRLMQLDEQMRVFGEVNRAARPLVVIARFGRDSLEGADAAKLAQDTLIIYRDLKERCERMIELGARLASAAAGLE